MPTFDIVSEVDPQEVTNAVDQASRELANRYDFRGTNSTIRVADGEIVVESSTDHRLDAATDVLKEKLVRRQVSLKALSGGTPKEVGGGRYQATFLLNQGIAQDAAKELSKTVRDSKLKVQVQIQGSQLRIQGKKRDELQQVIALLKDLDFRLPLQYVNFRETEVEFGLQDTRGSYSVVLTAARWAEDRGLACFALPDHYLAGRSPTGEGYDTRSADIYPYLGGLSIETSNLQLAALVSPITYRHPAALLKLGLAVDEMSAGRFTLGVGTGWMKAEHSIFGFPLPDWAERFDRLEEAFGYLRAALDNGEDGFTGTHYRLEPIDHQPKAPTLRLMIGGSGPRRTPELAGRFADEFNIYSQPASDLAVRIERAHEAATRAGRDSDSIMLSSVSPPVIGSDTATYRKRLEALAAARGVDVDRFEEQSRAIAVPMGTHEEARDTFGPVAEAGITRYYLQILGGFGLDYAAEILEVLSEA